MFYILKGFEHWPGRQLVSPYGKLLYACMPFISPAECKPQLLMSHGIDANYVQLKNTTDHPSLGTFPRGVCDSMVEYHSLRS